MALAICCLTATPARAATVLARARAVADEIVVAVDVSGGEGDLTALSRLADRLYEIDLAAFPFPEPAFAWLHTRCSAEWVLRVDDDEVLSAGLLEQLPELARSRDVLQYWLARRWLYPDPGHWLDEWPWFPDFQGRLVRNDARLWFPGTSHTSVALALPARYLDAGVYHLAHLLCDREQREGKVKRYLAVDPALRGVGADAYLETYYLPERHPGARSAAVEDRDREAIDSLLADPEGTGGARAGVPGARRVSTAEALARWAARELGADAYRARISPVDLHRRLLAGDHRPFRVRVCNAGSEWWPGGEDRQPLIRLAYRWLSERGEVVEGEGHRTALPAPLGPGESCLVAMNVTAPPLAGRYLLAPDLVHEHVRWFGCESTPLQVEVARDVGACG